MNWRSIQLKPISSDQFLQHYKIYKTWITKLKNKEPITRQEEYLAKKAKDTLIRSNIGLCIKYAAKYCNGNDCLFEDLMSEGILGLERALELYEPKRGYKFSTYATNWILQKITRYLSMKVCNIRVPINMSEIFSKARKIQEKAISDTGKPLSETELCKKLDISPRRYKVVKHTMQLASTVSLNINSVNSDADSSELLELIIDENQRSAIDELESTDLYSYLTSELPEKELIVLNMALGVNEEPCRISEISKRLKVAFGTVSRRRDNALKKVYRKFIDTKQEEENIKPKYPKASKYDMNYYKLRLAKRREQSSQSLLQTELDNKIA